MSETNDNNKKHNITVTFSEYLNAIIASQIIINAILSGSLNSINKYLSNENIRNKEEIKNLKPFIDNFFNKNFKDISNFRKRSIERRKVENKMEDLGVIEGGNKFNITSGNINSINKLKDFSELNEIKLNNPSIGLMITKSYFSNVSNIAKSIVGNGVKLADDFVSKIIDIVSGNILNEPWIPETNARVIVLAEYLKRAADDPKVIQAAKEVSESITDTGLQIADATLPGIQKILDKFIKTSENMATQGAEGAARAFISIASSTISLIPWLGGFISLLISIGSAFNSAMKVGLTFTKSAGEQAVTSAEVIKKTSDIISKNSQKVSSNLNLLKSAIVGNREDLPEYESIYKNIKDTNIYKSYRDSSSSSINDYIKKIKSNEEVFNREKFINIISESIEKKEIKNPIQLIPIFNFFKTTGNLDKELIKEVSEKYFKNNELFKSKIDELYKFYDKSNKNYIFQYLTNLQNSKEKFDVEKFKQVINKSIKEKQITNEKATKILNFVMKTPSKINTYELLKFINSLRKIQSGGIYNKSKKYNTHNDINKIFKNNKYINNSKRIKNSLYKFYNTRKNIK